VLAPAALSSIVAALLGTVLVMHFSGGAGVGVVSPPAIGIAIAAVVMIGFRIFAPALVTASEEAVS
jgi:SSS family solute:Na+ symporter